MPSSFNLGSMLTFNEGYRVQFFHQMWLSVFLWCLVSSGVLYSAAAVIAFTTLRRHSLGRFYSVLIFLMGWVIPLSLGLISSVCVSFVYKASNFTMLPFHAMMWGVGQTVIHAAVGFTRILATL